MARILMRLSRKGAILIVGLILVAVVVEGRRSPEQQEPVVRVGTALDVGDPFGVDAPLGVGQEVIDMFTSISNSSTEPVKLREIDLRMTADNGAGHVVGVFLVKRPFEGGLFNTLPPVTTRRGKCVVAELHEVRDYVLAPREEVMVAVHLSATQVGKFGWAARDITYLQGEGLYRQKDPYSFEADVRPRWRRELTRAERRCDSRSTLLPGWPGGG